MLYQEQDDLYDEKNNLMKKINFYQANKENLFKNQKKSMNSSIPRIQQSTKSTLPKLNLAKLKKPSILHTTRDPIPPKP